MGVGSAKGSRRPGVPFAFERVSPLHQEARGLGGRRAPGRQFQEITGGDRGPGGVAEGQT